MGAGKIRNRGGGIRPFRAKLFITGRSQAVCLPEELRFEGNEVWVHREGDAVILEAVARRRWPAGYWKRVARSAGDLELGKLEPLGAALARFHLDNDD